MIDSTPWAGRPHRGRPTVALKLTVADRATLEALLRTETTELRVARRAQGLVLLADGVCVPDVAMLLGINESTVNKWKLRFALKNPLDRLTDAPRSGRPISLFPAQTQRKLSPKRAARRAT